MARIYPLFSSSKGNAAFIGSPKGGILIDAGVSTKRLSDAMTRCGLSLEAIKGIFITHDHSDHVRGLKVLTKHRRVPVFAQPLTMRSLIDSDLLAPEALLHEIQDAPFEFAGCQITPFDTPHDTVQSCGYRVDLAEGRSCAVCTDLGTVTKTVKQALKGCDLVLLEANYDPDMLKTGPYPPQVKARIAGNRGHLSNFDSGAQAKWLVETGTTRLLLGHLSESNNTPEKAETAIESALSGAKRGQDYLLEIAAPETAGGMIAF